MACLYNISVSRAASSCGDGFPKRARNRATLSSSIPLQLASLAKQNIAKNGALGRHSHRVERVEPLVLFGSGHGWWRFVGRLHGGAPCLARLAQVQGDEVRRAGKRKKLGLLDGDAAVLLEVQDDRGHQPGGLPLRRRPAGLEAETVLPGSGVGRRGSLRLGMAAR